jgi:hypothetical protein
MNLAHVHIVLNHLPTLGLLAGMALFVFALVKKREDFHKLALLVLFVMAVVGLPTYVTGNAADRLVRDAPAYETALMESHQESAIVTLFLLTAIGVFAWIGLWQFRQARRPTGFNNAAVAVLAALTVASILNTANLGGKISHPEVRVEGQVAAEVDDGWQLAMENLMSFQSWAWPAAESLHFVGMVLVFGVALAVNLRMLGAMKSISFEAMHRLLPLGILGFVTNVVTGMVFFISSPGLYVGNEGFTMKVYMLVLCGLSVIYFTVAEGPWKVGEGQSAPLSAKIVSVLTMAFVLGAMYYGRLLPFLA